MTPDRDGAWPALPTETEIYILPNGEIVVADLPAELAAHLAQLTRQDRPESDSDSASNFDHVSNQQHSTQPD